MFTFTGFAALALLLALILNCIHGREESDRWERKRTISMQVARGQ